MENFTEAALNKSKNALAQLKKSTKSYYGKEVKMKKLDSQIGSKFTYTLRNGETAIVDIDTGDTQFV
jgi:hypothetical protein